LSHASGHAGLANAEAMLLAGVNKKSLNPKGGDILKDLGGNPTGIFNETAQNLIGLIIPKDLDSKNRKALELAIQECLKNGITSFHDAGIDSTEIDLYKIYAKENKLGIRIYAMLAGWNTNLLQAYYDNGPEIGLFDNHLTIRSIKLYADGALGSRGALLLEEYSDAPGVLGLRIQTIEEIRARSILAYENGFQICTHCIGDRANREVLDIYDSLTNLDLSKKGMLRYRIEHAQHISLADIPRFGEIGVIPSMQAIHLSSDRPWAIDRLGKQRIENGAYVWNKLTDSGATVMNGTDAPVEPVSALASFYASVSRQTLKGSPKGGYEADQIMTRTDALKSYTINNAFGAFEENIKGSIEVGKLADFTVFSKDIMEVEPSKILETEIEYTIIGGQIMYKK
jgi:predicted amidohydrolase YtcJ